MADVLQEVAKAAGVLLAGGGLGSIITTLIKARTSPPADVAKSAGEVVKALLDPLAKRVDTLEAEKIAHLARIEALEEENLACRSENRQLVQRVAGMERLLQRHGLALKADELEGGLLIIEKGEATFIKPIVPPRPSKKVKRP